MGNHSRTTSHPPHFSIVAMIVTFVTGLAIGVTSYRSGVWRLLSALSFKNPEGEYYWGTGVYITLTLLLPTAYLAGMYWIYQNLWLSNPASQKPWIFAKILIMGLLIGSSPWLLLWILVG